ncbi:cytochrome c biogenesis protein CcsA [Methylomarinum sp. Ch1-1]|uniref:Cytochrome c biogenesis protein CcsA n=1 Tax=Methylomarinum roseum TaxID=3067653 RepID=A0AAU7NVU2_9GAMM|nr:cytochrome c biogenesis protein CcsA [Methylomarinum sp. Ch1-1]MDP4519247.1 cytochrome c biogenesis protein CcsA [Methylomarinum sp. Ch1-1]
MNPAIIGILSICCYSVSTLLLSKDIIEEKSQPRSIYPGWLAVLLHFVYTAIISLQQNSLDFSFFSIGSTIASIIALLLLLASLNKPIEKLGVAIFPLASLTLALTMLLPGQDNNQLHYSWQMNTHIFSSIIAFSLLNIAALQAIFLAIQEQQLRKHPPRKIILTLPPLQTMESLLFQMITTGVIFLTVSLISGFIFIDDLFAQHLAHKTILSILAWVIFSALLFGRIRYGWRGKTAIQWTLIGFVLLLLGYFGSKLVLELILEKT